MTCVALLTLNTLRPRQNGRHFPDDIFTCIFLNENFWILNNISLKMFLRVCLTMWQHWFRWWLSADQATRHYLNQFWYVSLAHTCVPSAIKILNTFSLSRRHFFSKWAAKSSEISRHSARHWHHLRVCSRPSQSFLENVSPENTTKFPSLSQRGYSNIYEM